jgi:hypothetical protein
VDLKEDQCRKCSWYARVQCLGGIQGQMYRPGMFGCATFQKYTSHFKQSLNPPWDERLEDKMCEAAIAKFEAEEAERDVPRW